MELDRGQPIFENRYDAGRQLAGKLVEYKGNRDAVVLAIPNGGLPVALEVALALEVDLDLVIVRKIPVPHNPEAGFGAVADDGSFVLNDEAVANLGLSQHQINYQVNQVRAEIHRREQLFRKDRLSTAVTGKTVIIIDDGLASGFTMMAAVASVRRRQPAEIVAVIPVASSVAFERVGTVVDRLVTVAVGKMSRFYVADFYRYWHDLNDAEAVQCLKEWRLRHFRLDAKP